MSKTYDELPDTITPEDYADWRGIGIEYARTYFHTQGFPRLKNAGNRLAVNSCFKNTEIKGFCVYIDKNDNKVNS